MGSVPKKRTFAVKPILDNAVQAKVFTSEGQSLTLLWFQECCVAVLPGVGNIWTGVGAGEQRVHAAWTICQKHTDCCHKINAGAESLSSIVMFRAINKLIANLQF